MTDDDEKEKTPIRCPCGEIFIKYKDYYEHRGGLVEGCNI